MDQPLAHRRSRRSNAGARMHEMIFNAEDEELFAQTYQGLLKDGEDSSDDEEYVPKDLETGEGDGNDIDGNEDDDRSGSDESTSGSDSDDEEDEDEENDDEKVDSDCEKTHNNIERIRFNEDGVRIVEDLNDGHKNHTGIKLENTPHKHTSHTQPGSPTKAAYDSCIKICSVCLGDQSDEDDEIIECDSCGVSVHESCYGVAGDEQDDDISSVHSNISSESTEPWFCEPCKRSVKNPVCELCPNVGGIFKQTDTGRWIHMVCALYTRGITFENIDSLSEVSLFEINYALFGSKVR